MLGVERSDGDGLLLPGVCDACWDVACSPAGVLAQEPPVSGHHPLALSLRTNLAREEPAAQLALVSTDPALDPLFLVPCGRGHPALLKSTTNALCHFPFLWCLAVLLL